MVPGLQPFAYTMPGDDPNRPRAFGIGPKLREFLDDPVGERMGLSLPLYDAGRPLGENGGGWFRDWDVEGSFHGGTDFMGVFDVCAAQAGCVAAARGQGVVLEHETSAGRVFRTVYQHMDAASIQVKKNQKVRRGQLLGRPREDKDHLHFGVAVQPPAISGGPPPALPAAVYNDWYFIDPGGYTTTGRATCRTTGSSRLSRTPNTPFSGARSRCSRRFPSPAQPRGIANSSGFRSGRGGATTSGHTSRRD